ncbi:MAG: YcxB family protein [Alphaproteobacteria bacterium]|nr:MAG: YcxB family protein [Alphaproteobacteria bacterium]
MQPISFQLTAADLVDARLYVHNRKPLVRVIWVVVAAVAAGSLLRILFLAVQQDWGSTLAPALWLCGAIAFCVWGVFGNAVLLPPSARKQLSRDKGLQSEKVVAWDTAQFRISDSNGEGHWPWTDLHKWEESPNGLLLWLSGRRYFYLPKRSLTEPQLAEMRGILSETAKAS